MGQEDPKILYYMLFLIKKLIDLYNFGWDNNKNKKIFIRKKTFEKNKKYFRDNSVIILDSSY